MSPQERARLLRIGDAERERAQTELGEHYAAGRLDHDEYSQRLDQVWAARTQAELDPVFHDLPGRGRPDPAAAPWGTGGWGTGPWSTPAQRRTSSAARRGPRVPLPLLVLLVVLGVVAVLAHLPIVLVGLGVWFFFLRGGRCGSRLSGGRPARWHG